MIISRVNIVIGLLGAALDETQAVGRASIAFTNVASDYEVK